MICPNCDGVGRMQCDPDGTYPSIFGDTICLYCDGKGSVRKGSVPSKYGSEENDRLVRNLDKLMLHMNPVEFCCYEVMNHAGDLAVALLNVKVVDLLNEARMEILRGIEQRITDRTL